MYKCEYICYTHSFKLTHKPDHGSLNMELVLAYPNVHIHTHVLIHTALVNSEEALHLPEDRRQWFTQLHGLVTDCNTSSQFHDTAVSLGWAGQAVVCVANGKWQEARSAIGHCKCAEREMLFATHTFHIHTCTHAHACTHTLSLTHTHSCVVHQSSIRVLASLLSHPPSSLRLPHHKASSCKRYSITSIFYLLYFNTHSFFLSGLKALAKSAKFLSSDLGNGLKYVTLSYHVCVLMLCVFE